MNVDRATYSARRATHGQAAKSPVVRSRLEHRRSDADDWDVDNSHFPWRLLGALLVDEGLLTQTQLELALNEQRRTGRFLGQIVVDFGYVSAFSLARALAAQHGVELSMSAEEPSDSPVEQPTLAALTEWRPLGKLLVESGTITRSELEQAISEQRRDGRQLGQILVERGSLSGTDLARALAEQHGLGAHAVSADLDSVVRPSVAHDAAYQVWEITLAPAYRATSILYSSETFLDAADFAFEFIEENEPEALEIQHRRGTQSETQWMYSARRAEALANSRKTLTETFGFDPTTWDGTPPARDFTGSTE